MKQEFKVSGMSCAACQSAVTKAVNKLSGISNVDVNLLSGLMKVEFDEKQVSAGEIITAVKKIGYGAEIKGQQSDGGTLPAKSDWDKEKQEKKAELRKMKIRVIFSFVLLVPLLWVSMGSMIGLPEPAFLSGMENSLVCALYQLVLTTIIIFINKKFFISGARAFISKSPNMDSLVMLGSGAAYLYSLVITFIAASKLGAGDFESAHTLVHSLYFESSATILTLVTLGKFFEALSKQRTTNALDKLMELTPKTVCVIRNGEEQTISFESLQKGDLVLVRTGDVIAADGTVEEGEAVLDESAVTGESMPVYKNTGDKVISASICKDGTFKYRAECVGSDSTLEQIIKLVEEAGSSKAPISRVADKVSAVFVPVVMCISIITFLVWIIITGNIGSSLKSAISVLVISCPCALGLATPVAIMVAMGKSASFGVLIKSAEALETLSKTKIVVFDKTGTITKGEPAVTDIIKTSKDTEENVIFDLSCLEKMSTHPLSLAIIKAQAERNYQAEEKKLSKFKTVAGGGVLAFCGKEKWIAGSVEFVSQETGQDIMKSEFASDIESLKNNGKTIVVFAKGNNIECVLGIADEIRESSKPAIEELNKMGIKTILLSGDGKVVAEAVGKEVGVSEIYSEVLPQNKEKIVRELKSGGVTVMVGDGINDSPALSTADVGISISSGSDIARETADIILTNGSVTGVVSAIKLSYATLKNIKINLFWAFFYNSLGIPLAAGVLYPIFGWTLSPMIAALAMSLSSVCVVLNSLTLNLFKPTKNAKNTKNIAKNRTKKEIYMKKTIKIEGMMCAHCTARVTDTLLKLDGITSAVVSLENKSAVAEFSKEVSDKKIKKAIEEQGYTVVSIEKE